MISVVAPQDAAGTGLGADPCRTSAASPPCHSTGRVPQGVISSPGPLCRDAPKPNGAPQANQSPARRSISVSYSNAGSPSLLSSALPLPRIFLHLDAQLRGKKVPPSPRRPRGSGWACGGPRGGARPL